MLKALFYKTSSLPVISRPLAWWHNVRFYWLTGDQGNVAFFIMMMLPMVALGSILRFAYVEQEGIKAERKRRTDLACLAENVYFEARGEPLTGQRAVAEVTLNRVASPRFPSTVCEVVHEENWDPVRKRYLGAFSWTELESRPSPGGVEWQRAIEVASSVYDSKEAPVVDGALFYHAVHIEPAWAKVKEPVANIGRHIFYE